MRMKDRIKGGDYSGQVNDAFPCKDRKRRKRLEINSVSVILESAPKVPTGCQLHEGRLFSVLFITVSPIGTVLVTELFNKYLLNE